MPNRIKQWIAQQKQTRFHPSWILLVVIATASVAALIWVPAELVARKAEYHRLPTAAGPPPAGEAEPAEKKPDTIEQPGFLFPGRPRIIRVEVSPPGRPPLPADASGDAIRPGSPVFDHPRSAPGGPGSTTGLARPRA